MIFYRVSNFETKQGLWYDFNGGFTGLIHDKFSFCKNRDLEMPFDENIVGWLSATQTIDELLNWFTLEDISMLEKYGYRITMYTATDYKFYKNHWLIKQESSTLIKYITVDELLKLNKYNNIKDMSKSYGKFTVGKGSDDERELKIIDALELKLKDERTVTICGIEDGTYNISVQNPASSGRAEMNQIWLTEESLEGLIVTAIHYFKVKNKSINEIINNTVDDNNVNFKMSDNLIKNIYEH